jgi:predicted ATPase
VREIGQIGAAIGRDFSYSLLRAVAGRDETALTQALAQLEQSELVFRRGELPEAVYSFKHALVRDAAYESLLKSRRQPLHGKIAHALEEEFADIVVSQPEIVAYHFTEAGLVDTAIDYWLKAGQHAARRSANAEALNHLARGFELLPKVDDPMLRNKSELLLQTLLGHSLLATKGWSVESVTAAVQREWVRRAYLACRVWFVDLEFPSRSAR